MADDLERDSAPRKPRNRFNLALVPAVSAALVAFGCGPSPRQSTPLPAASIAPCTDAQGNPLPASACNNPGNRSPSSRSGFHTWYSVGGTAGFGTGVRGGASSTAHGHVTRGGFGSSAHASGASSSHAGG
jgi:hypothetical protein